MSYTSPRFQRGAMLQLGGAGGAPPRRTRTASGGPSPVSCDFCGRVSPDTGVVFAGQGSVLICQYCVEQAHEQLEGSGAILSGPKPIQESAARAEIEEAFARMSDTNGEENEDLTFVEGGAGLAKYLRQAGQAYEGSESQFVVDSVHFLSGTEAAVAFRITGFMEMPFTGGAVLDSGRWKVARDTLAGLLAGAGVFIPPRAA